MSGETFGVGTIVISATADSGQILYHGVSTTGLRYTAPTVSELLLHFATAIEEVPGMDDPLGCTDGLAVAAQVLEEADEGARQPARRLSPWRGRPRDPTDVMRDAFNTREGTAMMGLLSVPEATRLPFLRDRGLCIRAHPSADKREGMQLTLVRKTGQPEENAHTYIMPVRLLSVHFSSGTLTKVPANVLASRQWLSDTGLCPKCEGACQCDAEADSTPAEPLVTKLPEGMVPGEMNTGMHSPDQLIGEYLRSSAASFKALSPNPHPNEAAEVIGPLFRGTSRA